MKPTLMILAAAGFATSAMAQETREMDAHVHGVSTAEIAVEHGTVAITLRAPGMDIVGFEYEPGTQADKDAVDIAIRALLTPENIVALPEAAGCRISEVLARLSSGEDDHDDHAEEDQDEDDDAHTEFHARYIFACDDEAALTSVSFPFFEQFENAEEIEAQYVTETGAGTAELTRGAAELSFE